MPSCLCIFLFLETCSHKYKHKRLIKSICRKVSVKLYVAKNLLCHQIHHWSCTFNSFFHIISSLSIIFKVSSSNFSLEFALHLYIRKKGRKIFLFKENFFTFKWRNKRTFLNSKHKKIQLKLYFFV